MTFGIFAFAENLYMKNHRQLECFLATQLCASLIKDATCHIEIFSIPVNSEICHVMGNMACAVSYYGPSLFTTDPK